MNPLADVPRSRNTDPKSSHLAADRIKATGALGKQQREVLELVRKFPGQTSAELASIKAALLGEPWEKWRPMFGRRLAELRAWIEPGATRTCNVTGNSAQTWFPK